MYIYVLMYCVGPFFSYNQEEDGLRFSLRTPMRTTSWCSPGSNRGFFYNSPKGTANSTSQVLYPFYFFCHLHNDPSPLSSGIVNDKLYINHTTQNVLKYERNIVELYNGCTHTDEITQ